MRQPTGSANQPRAWLVPNPRSPYRRIIQMKTITTLLAGLALATTMAVAQSAGSFNYSIAQTACTDTVGLLGTGVIVPALKTTMKVSSGNGNVLVVRPSGLWLAY